MLKMANTHLIFIEKIGGHMSHLQLFTEIRRVFGYSFPLSNSLQSIDL